MDFEAIGRKAVEWRKAEGDKAATRKVFMAAHIVAVEDHGSPCRSGCKHPEHCEGEDCKRKAAIHAQTRTEYDSWITASRAASAARGSLTRAVKQETQKQEKRDSEALSASDDQGDLFEVPHV
jgi:hypothetical protein